MPTIHVHRRTDADALALFTVLADPASYRHFPGVRSAELLQPGGSDPFGVGAVRRIVVDGFRFDEEITHHEPGVRLGYRIIDSSPAIDHELGTIRFAASGGGTDVEWTSTFRVRTPVVGGLVARLGARRMARAFSDAIRIGAQLATNDRVAHTC